MTPYLTNSTHALETTSCPSHCRSAGLTTEVCPSVPSSLVQGDSHSEPNLAKPVWQHAQPSRLCLVRVNGTGSRSYTAQDRDARTPCAPTHDGGSGNDHFVGAVKLQSQVGGSDWWCHDDQYSSQQPWRL